MLYRDSLVVVYSTAIGWFRPHALITTGGTLLASGQGSGPGHPDSRFEEGCWGEVAERPRASCPIETRQAQSWTGPAILRRLQHLNLERLAHHPLVQSRRWSDVVFLRVRVQTRRDETMDCHGTHNNHLVCCPSATTRPAAWQKIAAPIRASRC